MRRQITYWKEECGLALEQNSSFHACPPCLTAPWRPPLPPPPHSSPCSHQEEVRPHPSRALIKTTDYSNGPVQKRGLLGGNLGFTPFAEVLVKSDTSPWKRLWTGLKDRAPNDSSPPSQLTASCWLALQTCLHKQAHAHSAYRHTMKREQICSACCKKYFTPRYAYLATDLRSAPQLPAHILFKPIVTSVHGSTGLEARSLFLNAVWMLSPCFRGPLGDGFSSHRHVAEFLGLLLPLTGEVASELELAPGRGAVIAHSS